MQLVLTGEIDGKARALRPLEEMPVIARPAGGCVLVGVTTRKRPLHVWIARRSARRRIELQWHPRRLIRQHDEAATPWTLEAHGRRILIAVRPRDSLVVIRASPGVVGRPRPRCRDLQNPRAFFSGERAHDEKMMCTEFIARGSLGAQGDPVGT